MNSTVKPLTARRASAALRKAGLSVQHCRDGGGRGLDVLCYPTTDTAAVVQVLESQGWANVRVMPPNTTFTYVFANYPVVKTQRTRGTT